MLSSLLRSAPLASPALQACALAGLLVSCKSPPSTPPSFKGISTPLQQAPSTISRRNGSRPPFDVETSVAVVPPGVSPHCPAGAALIAHGSPGASLTRVPLDCLASSDPASCSERQPADVAPGGKVLLGGTPAGDRCVGGSPSQEDRYYPFYTDTQVVHLGGGRLVRSIPGSARMADPSGCARSIKYDLVFTRRSDDCGRTWVDPTVFDPQELRAPFVSAFDRPNLLVDPFTQAGAAPLVYLSGGVDVSGTGRLPGDGLDSRVLLRSHDGGRSWRMARLIKGGWPRVMYDDAMTTLPDGTLVIFGCVADDKHRGPNGGIPTLLWSPNNGDSFQEAVVTFPGEPDAPHTCGLLEEMLTPGPITNRTHHVTISRVAPSKDHPRSHLLRLAYTHVEAPPGAPRSAWRQVLRVLEGEIPRRDSRDFSPVFRPLFVQRGAAPNRIVLQASFIEPDGVSGPRRPDGVIPDAALLWWNEGDHGTSQYTTFYRTVDGAHDYGPETPAAIQDSVPRWWRLPTGKCEPPCWYGDYDHGAYYFDATSNTHRYLMVWSETHPEETERNAFLHHQTVARPTGF